MRLMPCLDRMDLVCLALRVDLGSKELMRLISELNHMDRRHTKMLGLTQVKQLALAMTHRRKVTIVRKRGTSTTTVIGIMGGMMTISIMGTMIGIMGLRRTISSLTLASHHLQPRQMVALVTSASHHLRVEIAAVQPTLEMMASIMHMEMTGSTMVARMATQMMAFLATSVTQIIAGMIMADMVTMVATVQTSDIVTSPGCHNQPDMTPSLWST